MAESATNIFIHTNCYLQVNDLNFAESAMCNVLQVSRQDITTETPKNGLLLYYFSKREL